MRPETAPRHEGEPLVEHEARDLLSKLIAVNTVGDGESGAAAVAAAELHAAGLVTKTLDWRPNRNQLIATTPGTDDGPPLTFTGHLDTVPANPDDWSSDPWTATVNGDQLAGRGASDMKSGVAAFIVALAHHRRRQHDCRPVQLVLTAAEETGCEGAADIPSSALRRGGWLLVGEPTSNRLVLGHKGGLWLRLATHGVSAHGSAPHLGRNAIVAAARAAVSLHDTDDWPTDSRFGPVTANVGTIAGGAQVNVVPDAAQLALDLRHGPSVPSERLAARVAEIVGPDVDISTIARLSPVDTPTDSPFAHAVSDALEQVGLDPTPAPPARFFTDASVLTELLGAEGTVICGPGEPEQCHVVDEWCSVTRLGQAAKVYSALLDTWCATGIPTG
ncbi:M20/M25/M40 family metallo-hydrolase [Spiractinospora alimapuensis]|uniref:M20 family metallopeptidase n=1 Tax=Spiractinospora alimapuensis TaxID=2820884 RepID=UPI001F230587|nr:M20/M25/M40 family metallo-hydrolase [Spiractinospora alimapuensis]QVQ51780.1 M20/M25/M40 family metallo-hydrolase [Spiractinospora alimapuensis]